jgi:hypothetical protein
MRDLDYFAYGSNLHPLRFDWYLDYVLRGGRYHGLSGRYLAALARTERQRDRIRPDGTATAACWCPAHRRACGSRGCAQAIAGKS